MQLLESSWLPHDDRMIGWVSHTANTIAEIALFPCDKHDEDDNGFHMVLDAIDDMLAAYAPDHDDAMCNTAVVFASRLVEQVVADDESTAFEDMTDMLIVALCGMFFADHDSTARLRRSMQLLVGGRWQEIPNEDHRLLLAFSVMFTVIVAQHFTPDGDDSFELPLEELFKDSH